MSDTWDIAVVGGGAAGIAAAITAARAGCKTLLLEQRPGAGGTAGYSGLTTLCGLYDDAGEFLNDGFVREFAVALAETLPLRMGRVWVLPYRPERFRGIAASLLSATPRLEARWTTPLAGVLTEGDRIVGLNGVRVRAVIDCSGDAEVARAVGSNCLATDETTQAPAIILSLRRVTRDWSTPAAAVQVLLPLARAGFPPVSFTPSPEPSTLTMKFTGTAAQVTPLIEFLRARVAGFEHCEPGPGDLMAVPRAGRMIVGRYVLTGADVRAARKFPDAVTRCAWPIEQWAADGRSRLVYLPQGTYYEIPARSLVAAKPANLWMGGKTISADVEAIASARVMGCCLATGAAAGQLAAAWLGSSDAT